MDDPILCCPVNTNQTPTAYIRRASLKAHLAVDIAGAMCKKVLSFFTWALTFARE